MQVDLNCVKSGEACWNVDAITAHADEATSEELRESCAFDVQVFPGKIACTGCAISPNGQDTLCSAQLTPTRVEVWGHPIDTKDSLIVSLNAVTSLSEIPDFKPTKPALDEPS
jgi:hypothetical protein